MLNIIWPPDDALAAMRNLPQTVIFLARQVTPDDRHSIRRAPHAMKRFTLPYPARIVEIRQENYRTKTLALDTCLDASPGQFAMLWQPRFDEKPFSLVSADPVTVMITDVGPFSHLMHEKQVGDRIWLRGPLGRGFRVSAAQRRIVLVGGGYGVAPLHWLARTAEGRTETVTTIIGARCAPDILYADAFASLAPTSAPTSPTARHHRRWLAGACAWPRHRCAAAAARTPTQVDGIYACGPHGMLAALAGLASSSFRPAPIELGSLHALRHRHLRRM
jgi:dihydroorotate dehydrogenase electron transfer subunit